MKYMWGVYDNWEYFQGKVFTTREKAVAWAEAQGYRVSDRRDDYEGLDDRPYLVYSIPVDPEPEMDP